MKKPIGFLVLSFWIALILLQPVSAQTESEDPFLPMLANVPDYEASRNELSYSNFQAMGEAWDVSDVTMEDVSNHTEAGDRWLSAMDLPFAISLGAGPVLRIAMPDMQQVMGFTMLDVHQALIFGVPPGQGHILTGEFDPEAIRAVLAARDFEQRDLSGIEVWCWVEGCDKGIQQDLTNINHANIFGGMFGRREPLAIGSPEMLLDSASLETITWLIGAQQDATGTLADAPEYRALAETLAAQGTLLQVYMVNPELVRTWDFTDISLPPVTLENAITSVRTYFGQLPPYQLFAFAQTWRDGRDFAQVILIYEDAASAEAAAAELHTRLVNGSSFRGRDRTYGDVLSNYGEILPPSVYEDEGFAAAIFTVQAAPSDDLAAPSPYRVLVQMIYNRDLYFLGTDITLPPE